MDFMPFFLLSLAVWRIASLFANEDGIFDIFIRFRALVGVKELGTDKEHGTNWFNSGLICVKCNSLWIGLLAAFVLLPQSVGQYFVLALALSAMAIIVDSFINR